MLVNLVIDIGNTSTKLAVFEGSTLVEVISGSGQAVDALTQIISSHTIEQGIVATVVDVCHDTLEKLSKLSFPV